MSAKLNAYLKVMPAGRALVIMLIVILATAVIIAFAWMQTEQVISPPGLRMADWLWRVVSAPVLSRISSELYMRALSGLI
jgi:hypothetical protein